MGNRSIAALASVERRAAAVYLSICPSVVCPVSMAAGVVLTRKWRPRVTALTFTAWQLTAGGLLLLSFALLIEPALPVPDIANLVGFLWLGLAGAAISYFFWFRGIERLGPNIVTSFGFLSPLTAVLLGWAVLGEALSPFSSPEPR